MVSPSLKVKRVLSTALLTWCIFNFVNGQTLQQKLTVSIQSQPASVALEVLETGRDFHFSYNPTTLPSSSITIEATDVSLRKILNSAFGKDYQFVESGRHVIILHQPKKTEQPKQEGQIAEGGTLTHKFTVKGTVRDVQTNKPLAHTTVFDVTGLYATSTDENGVFELDLVSRKQTIGLGISKEYYLDTAFVLPAGPQEIDVSLREMTVAQRESIANFRRDTLQPVGTASRIARATLPTNQASLVRNTNFSTQRRAQFSFVPGLGSNRKLSGTVTNNFSFNLLSGYSGGVDGVEVGGLVNITRARMHGIQIGGLSNIVGERVWGVQIGGLFNYGGWDVNAIQIGGLMNVNRDRTRYVQVAGLGSVSGGTVTGLQIGGLFNAASADVQGGQFSGVYSHTDNKVIGLQASGIHSQAGQVWGLQVGGIAAQADTVWGAQFSGISNLSGRATFQVAGIANASTKRAFVQIAGILNIAKRVDGVQIGLFNYASEIKGVPIGLLSIVKDGYHKISIGANETGAVSGTLKTGVPYFYNIVRGSINTWNPSPYYTVGYGLGTGVGFGQKAGMNMDFIWEHIIPSEQPQELIVNELLSFDMSFRYSPSRFFELAAGPSFRAQYRQDPNQILVHPPHYSYQELNNYFDLWFGWNVELRFL